MRKQRFIRRSFHAALGAGTVALILACGGIPSPPETKSTSKKPTPAAKPAPKAKPKAPVEAAFAVVAVAEKENIAEVLVNEMFQQGRYPYAAEPGEFPTLKGEGHQVVLGHPRSKEVADAYAKLVTGGYSNVEGVVVPVQTDRAQDLQLILFEEVVIDLTDGSSAAVSHPQPQGFSLTEVSREVLSEGEKCTAKTFQALAFTAAQRGALGLAWVSETDLEGMQPCVAIWPPPEEQVGNYQSMTCEKTTLFGSDGKELPFLDAESPVQRVQKMSTVCRSEPW